MVRGLHLTIDEWFYHWFADAEKLTRASSFFFRVFKVCDKTVIQKGTRLAHKFFFSLSILLLYIRPKKGLQSNHL